MADISYSKINWENEPSHNTPLSAQNLNKMDTAIYDLVTKSNSLVPNPAESPTEGLEKLEYDGTVYEVKGGHKILNDSGSVLTQMDNMQFNGVYTHNASTITEVDIVREFSTVAEIEALTGEAKKGFEVIEDTEEYIPYTGSDILFDNTDTSFEGDNVQEVLEEVDGKFDDISTPIDISSQIVFNETYIDPTDSNTIVNVIKMGKMVVVTISGLALKQALSGSTTFISNFPIPKFDINVGLSNPISGQAYTSRCRLRNTGELKIWFDSIPQNSIPYGQFIYFTN